MYKKISSEKGNITIEATCISNIIIFFIVALVNVLLTVYDNNIVNSVISDTVVFVEYNNLHRKDKNEVEKFVIENLEKRLVFLDVTDVDVVYANKKLMIDVTMRNNSKMFRVTNSMFDMNRIYEKSNLVHIYN